MILHLGLSVSLSSDGSILAMGGNGDNDYIGATWLFGSDGGTYQQRGNKLVAASALGDQGEGSVPCISYIKHGIHEHDELVCRAVRESIF
jgi:hypothetical protein